MMDLQKIISDLIAKFTGNSELTEKFGANPVETVKGLLGSVNLDENQLKTVVEGVSAKINIENAVKEGGGILDKIKGFFGG